VSRKNAFGIYQAIEHALKRAKTPLTCVDLFELEEVRKFAEDVNKVSDYLGHMWRRSQELPEGERFIGRQAAPRGVGSARWAYYWKNPAMGTPGRNVPVQRREAQPRLAVVNLRELAQRTAEVKQLASTPSANVTQSDDGTIVVETLHHTITIKPR
jgi:hypothetical protein